ncbi:hypothetical protein [Olleya sp. Bg11-27]|uniref:hypothetical protein n=1 Tax=Olleya sp. Bg11-27 TaxID=2058135 RepID=UPI000C301894|nr:hypothetical protein [Olleya sp. Bg11-27]AUC77566.1 hypothetical protein CW732_18525 [Olleya sp. Bg11-27]
MEIIKNVKKRTLIILFFGVCLFSTTLFAQGPNAPEAAGFEPVDATDMVNLLTGDLSYVLPVLNVPSPEGGYPLALSYHGGVGMDQESSWVGLGWSLNPGAINRSVNGYPDDWKNSLTENIIYDAGGEVTDFTSTLSLGPSTTSLALSLAYSSNKGFGGSVGFSGIVSYNKNQGIGVSIPIKATDKIGVSVTRWAKNNQVSVGLNNRFAGLGSVGVSIGGSSIGVSMSTSSLRGGASNSIGSGMSVPLGKGLNTSAATIRTSFIAAGNVRSGFWGVSLSYRKSHYSLYDNRDYLVNGVCYPFNASDLVLTDQSHDTYLKAGKLFDANDKMPAYDSYSVSAQGISGSFSPKYIKSTAIIQETEYGDRTSSFGDTDFLTRKLKDDIINYSSIEEVSLDNNNLHFYFDYDNSSYLEVLSANQNFNMNLSSNLPITEIENLNSPLNTSAIINGENVDNYNVLDNRKKSGKFIEEFRVSDILNGNASANGFLHSKDPNNNNSYSTVIFENIDENAIGGFKITTLDGKTYHYSLPVYQCEEFVREYVNKINEDGVVIDLNEDDKFMENRKFDPYATHWLLTAITGPDYIKNDVDREYPEQGDYGYWVRFDYGKWSDGFGWESRSSENKYISDSNYAYVNGPRRDSSDNTKRPREIPAANSEVNIKAYGVKQVYYLNQIKTRTHTALFVKSDRVDNKGKMINVGSSVNNPLIHDNVKKTSNINDQSLTISDAEFRSYIKVPEQKSLGLDKIILLKNNSNIASPNTFDSQGVNGQMFFSESYVRYNVLGQNLGTQTRPIHNRNWGTEYYGNVLDVNDINSDLMSNAIKVIDFEYNSSNSAYKNSITLKSVIFQGRGGVSIIPPYRFSYNTRSFNENEEEENWGFNAVDPKAWSLKEIETPLGGVIKIEYESDSYFPLLNKWCANRGCIEVIEDRELFVGGGLRVKSLSLYENNIFSNKELYNYNMFDTNITSGVSIYTPRNAPFNSHFIPTPQVFYKNVEVVSQGASSNSEILKNRFSFDVFNLDTTEYSRIASDIDGFFLAEGSVLNFDEDGLNRQSFVDLGDLVRDGLRSSTLNKTYQVRLKNRNIIDNFSRLGRLKTMVSFNYMDQIISKTENIFAETDSIIQGKVKEGYFSYQKNSVITYAITNDPILDLFPNWQSNIHRESYYYDIGSTYITRYPSVLKSIKTLTNNQFSSIENTAFDFNTGQVLETIQEDSKGNKFKIKVVPAYSIQNYNPSTGFGMGSKVDNITNKNMLSQEVMSTTYVNYNGNWKETGVGITTWSNKWDYSDSAGGLSEPSSLEQNIWRKHNMFVWDGNMDNRGAYQGFVGGDDNFDWTVVSGASEISQVNSKWKNVSTTTKYDHYSMPLEQKDINNNYITNKMCDNSTKISLSADARYGEAFYSSAEYSNVDPLFFNFLDQGIKGTAYRSSDYAHTGDFSLKISSSSQRGFETTLMQGEHKLGDYKISVWIKKDNASNTRIHINGVTKGFNGERIIAGDWVMYNHYEELQMSNETIFITTVNGTIYIDDFRIHPIASSMTSYVYNEWDELSYIIGSNNLGTHFIYDSQGRLIETQTEVIDTPVLSGGFKKVSENFYNYKNQ